jgi:Flp pilus assembly pilin Flp
MRRSFGHPTDADRGATAIEYALLIALVGSVVFASVTFLGGRLTAKFTSAAGALVGVGGNAGGGSGGPCAVLAPEGTPAPTCTVSGGAAVWSCPANYTVDAESTSVACEAASLPAYSGSRPADKINGGSTNGWTVNLDAFSGLTYGTPSCSGNSGACAKISYSLGGGSPRLSATSAWSTSDSASVTVPWTATQSGHQNGSGSITVTIQ